MHVILGMYKSTEIVLYYLSRTKFWTSYRFLWHIWILWDVWFLCFEKIEKILTWWWDLRLLPSSAHTMTATFAHLHLAASLNIPTKTFFSVRLTNSNWSTKLTSTFTYSTRRNMAIFHPMLATAFQTGKSKHPQNVSRIFYWKCLLFD